MGLSNPEKMGIIANNIWEIAARDLNFGAMSAKATHPCTVIAAQRVRTECTDDFLRAQEKISAAMQRFPGFIGKELIRPAPGLQDEWVSVFRFSSTESLQRWMQSEERRAMIAELDACSEGQGSLQIVAGDEEEMPPVTVVFSHRVKEGCWEKFRAWRDDILREMRGWSGFLDVDVFDPRPGIQEESVMIVRFDSAASFEGWMGSARRARLIERLGSLVDGYTARPLGSGLGGWFAFDDAPAAPSEPPRWKQILMVTLGLYPTVMLLALLIDPWLRRWVPFPVQMLIGNLLCVSLLTWPVMPWLNRKFARWLTPMPRRPAADLVGALVIAVLLALWVALFLAVWPRIFGGVSTSSPAPVARVYNMLETKRLSQVTALVTFLLLCALKTTLFTATFSLQERKTSLFPTFHHDVAANPLLSIE